MRLSILEDNSLLLENLKLILGCERGIDVVGAFYTAEEAFEALLKCPPEDAPELMVVDLGLPGLNGVDFIRKAKDIMPDLLIMVHTIYEDKDNVFAAIKAGASGYLLKGSTPRELVEAVFNLYEGGAPMSPKIARKLISEFQNNAQYDEFILSTRENQIISEISTGCSYKDIAERFNISPNTVHSHIKKIYDKLHANNRKDAILRARQKGLI